MKPNLFLIGASKCGSTFLHDLLKQHPEIFMSDLKELHFFNKDYSEEELSCYLENFSGSDGFSYAGESSPVYSETTYFKETPERIYDFNSDSKIIYLVRNPFARLASVYKQALSSGHHLELKYYDRLMPDNFSEAIYSYPPFVEACRYYTHLQNYRKYFPDAQIKVVIFEDLIGNTQQVLKEIFEFLGVNRDAEIDMSRAEQNSGSQKRALRSFARELDKGIFYRILRNLPSSLKSPLKKIVSSLLSQKINKVELSEEDENQVLELLRPEVEGVYRYLGIADDPWLFLGKNPSRSRK